MSYLPKPPIKHPGLKKNKLGLTVRDYEGALSTLCAGCGHDSVTAALVQAFFELDIDPVQVCKMSGIGCSSKTPGYFLKTAHGFNSVHGRMPSVTTGANAAARQLIYVGVSGDGDTASIGLGQFIHAIRRKVNMLYVVENNGCYGLTKGQFSATADLGTKNKKGVVNQMDPIDPVCVALQAGAGFVARGFSGDKEQLVPLIKAGLQYRGFALIDVVSPCVSFNNHDGSTKSYHYFRQHDEVVNKVALVGKNQCDVGGGEDLVQVNEDLFVKIFRLEREFNNQDRLDVLKFVYDHLHRQPVEIVTGLLYCDVRCQEHHDFLNTITTNLRDLSFDVLVPSINKLMEVNKKHGLGQAIWSRSSHHE